MTTQFGYSEEPEAPAEAPAEVKPETAESTGFGRYFKKADAAPFLFAGAIIVGATALYERVFGKKPRAKRIIRRLVKR